MSVNTLVDPLIVECDKCKQPKDKMCIRLGGYGTGNPLRRVHHQRRATAIEHVKKQLAQTRANFNRVPLEASL